MRKFVTKALLCVPLFLAFHAHAQAQSPAAADPGFEKKQFNYSAFSKGRFSEVITVTGPAKMIFLSGLGPEADDGSVQHKDNFLEQCRYAYGKVKKLLAEHGATINDIVRQTVYIVDVRNREDYGKCRTEAFANATLPTSTGVYISALAFPYMLFEIEITASVAAK